MLTRSGIHAIRAMAILAELPEGGYLGAGAIAEKIGAPQNYLGKLLQLLTHEGLVISQKGAGGGFRLGKDARELSLLEVVEPIERVSRWEGCILGRPTCSEENPCALHERWKAVRDVYLEFLARTNIADITATSELGILAE